MHGGIALQFGQRNQPSYDDNVTKITQHLGAAQTDNTAAPPRSYGDGEILSQSHIHVTS